MQITALSNGGFVAVWNHRVGTDDTISFRIFDANGNAVGFDQTITHPSPGMTDVRPTVAAVASGGFIVGWESYSLTVAHQIWTQRFDANGIPVTSPFMTSDTRGGDSDPSIDRNPSNGDTVVVWQDSFGNNGSNGGIWGSYNGFTFRVDAATNAVGKPANSDPEVAFDGLGNFFTAWSQHVSGVNYTLSGTINAQATSSFQINTATVGFDMLPQVVGLAAGGWLVLWRTPTVNSQSEIHGQLITSAGALSGVEFQIASGIISLNRLEAEAVPDGRVMVTWESGGHTFAEYIDLRSGAVTWNGSASNDQYAGTSFGDILNGMGGNDYVAGWSGNDYLLGNAGNDTLDGGDGNDRLYGQEGNDSIRAGAGEDILAAGIGNDTVNAGADIDFVLAEEGDDSVTGGDARDLLYGQAGNDSLYGDAADDFISGGDDNDLLVGGTGLDVLFGDAGNDIGYGEADRDWVYGFAGNDTLYGGAGDDVIGGSDGLDELHGDDGADAIFGEAGNDTIFGDAGFDYIVGGGGVNTISLGSGLDIVQSTLGEGGTQRVSDFGIADFDQVWLVGWGFANTVAALAACQQVGADVVLQNGADQIVLQNLTVGQLNTYNFVLF